MQAQYGAFKAEAFFSFGEEVSNWVLGNGTASVDNMFEALGPNTAVGLLWIIDRTARMGLGVVVKDLMQRAPSDWSHYVSAASALRVEPDDFGFLVVFMRANLRSVDGLEAFVRRFEQRFPNFKLEDPMAATTGSGDDASSARQPRWNAVELSFLLQAFAQGDAFWTHNSSARNGPPSLAPSKYQFLNDLGLKFDPSQDLIVVGAKTGVSTLRDASREGRLRPLVEALRKNWALSKIELGPLAAVLEKPAVASFFLDPNNARDFARLAKAKKLPHTRLSDLVGIFKPKHIETKLEGEVAWFSDSATFAQRALEWPERFDSPYVHDRPDRETQDDPLSELATGFRVDEGTRPLHQALLFSTPSNQRLAGELEALGLSRSNARDLIGESLTATRLISAGPVSKPTLMRLMAIHGQIKPTKSLVKAAGLLRPSEAALDAYASLVGPTNDGEPIELQADVLRALEDRDVRARIASPELKRFVRRLSELGVKGAQEPAAQIQLAQHPELLQLDDATMRSRVASLKRLASPFGLVEIPSRMIARALSLDLVSSESHVRSLIEKLKARGEQLSPNDIPLLYEVANRKELAERLDDPARMHGALLETYRLRDGVVLAASFRPPGPWNERVAPDALESLDALRAVLWSDALSRDAFKAQLGVLIASDLTDGGSESGGIAELDSQGRLKLRGLPGRGLDDGTFHATGNPDFHGGITTFHFHALEPDMTPSAGPSGDLGASGDIGFVDHYRSTDVVVTTLGHPKVDGREDTSRIRINVDLYTVNRNSEPELKIVDLGVFTVPLPASSSR